MTKEVINTQVEEQVNEVTNVQETTSYQQVIKKLIGSGCKKTTNLKVKNINAENKGSYVRIAFTLTTPVRSYITEDNGLTWKEGLANTIYTTLYAISGSLKEDEELSWLGGIINEFTDFNILKLLFNGATIDIIQQDIIAGEEFKNPFSTNSNTLPQVYDHDIIISHVIKIKLGVTGLKMVEKLADKMMAKALED